MIGDSETDCVAAVTAALRPASAGWVFWITGLARAGKTTIGSRLFTMIRAEHPNSVFLDGDQLRAALCSDLGYSLRDREECSRR